MTARAGTEVGIEAQFGGRGRAVITASSAMEYAFEGEELADVGEPEPGDHAASDARQVDVRRAGRDGYRPSQPPGHPAACLVGIAVARTDEIRLSRWPGRAGLTWIIVLIGAAAAVALVFHSHNLSAAALDLYLPISIWTAVMALIVPVCATAVTPRRFAVALLGGWLAADVAVLVYFSLYLTYLRDQGYAVISTVPLIVFGLALVALVPAAALFARGAPTVAAESERDGN